ncbi:MAG: arylsulfatase [Alphaproteobacteria bacterium]|nr:arylsulfatase [Alphaproteobacteria bacterium]MBU0795419.1 arylsulfatase [Alphaproteobacteria bacterium]MBU0877086.1 arylsulfatase [Alphaproteobacteria bacterium]MBU1770898.1 arylsulfatase [Alphaproteobacteria bacterium]
MLRTRTARLAALVLAGALTGLLPAPVWAGQTEPKGWTHFPKESPAPVGAPNILIIMTDDVGFGAASGTGGPIPTPSFDRLVRDGLLYNRFHTTAMCSPTRAALLTGRNHHSVGAGVISNMATDQPGYTSAIPTSAATIGRVLGQHGYATAWLGKNHNTPGWETGPLGPFERWPNGMGFDYFYGFNGDRTNQFFPELIENRNPVEAPREADYILDRDLADHAIGWLRRQATAAPDRPFLMYYAPGTAHVPLQAPADWIARFKGRFADGWDVERERTFARQKALGVIPADAALTPRPDGIPAWSTLPPAQKRIAQRQMEVYAAALAYCDEQIGRVLAELERSGRLENTLVLYLQGDNGAAAENMRGAFNQYAAFAWVDEEAHNLEHLDKLGGPHSFPAFPVGWAWAMNTPFQWAKMTASHLGGTRNALAVSWPQGIGTRGIRSQFHHVIDIAPTLYEIAGIDPPETIDGVPQQPIEGVSIAYSFNDPAAEGQRTSQYFEMLGNRAFYRDGWMAATTPKRLPWEADIAPGEEGKPYRWELYDLDADFSQSRDLAAARPETRASLEAGFTQAAQRHQVLPIDDSFLPRFSPALRPGLLDGRRSVTYHADEQRIAPAMFPDLSRDWQATASFTTETVSAGGPIIASGDKFSGWAVYLRHGIPMMLYRGTDQEGDRTLIAGSAPLQPGQHVLRFGMSLTKGDTTPTRSIWLEADGQRLTQKSISRPARPASASYVGRVGDAPLIEDSEVPGRFDGSVDQVRIDFAP